MGKQKIVAAPPTLVRNSERSSYKTCRQRWWWSYVDHYKPVEAAKPLRFGDLIHQALAAYYKKGEKRGPKPSKTFVKLYNKQAEELADQGFNIFADEAWVDAEELGVDMLERYYNRYHEHDLQYRVLASEQTFHWPVDITTPDGHDLRIIVVGTVDGIWEHIDNPDDKFFAEHKTAAQIKLTGLPMDDQASLYWTYGPAWAEKAGIIEDKSQIRHILYNFLRKATDDPRPQNEAGLYLNQPSKDDLLAALAERDVTPVPPKTKDSLWAQLEEMDVDPAYLGEVSKSQPPPYFLRQPIYRDHDDKVNAHLRISAEAGEMDMVRRGVLPVYKNPGPLHMPNCQGCGFKDMCELHETGDDWESVKRATMTVWDPYDAHEQVERR